MTLLAAVTAEPSATAQTVRSLVGLAVCGLSARRGYRRAELVVRETGQLPRGWSPTTWSGICFSSLVVGHVWLSTAAGKARVAAPSAPLEPVAVGPDPRFSWGPTDDAVPAWARSAPTVPAQPLGTDAVVDAPPTAPAPLLVAVPAVVQAPPKPFSMNPRPVWSPAGEAPPVAAPEPPAPAPVAPLPLAPLADVVDVAPEPAGPTEVADEPVGPPEVPRVVAMDVLPAATGRKRR